jgi:hypothetical protein
MEAVAQKAGSVRAGEDDSGMAQNFLGCDREQELLLPPSLREWLPEDHLVWFVIDAVAAMDLEASMPPIASMAGVGRRTSRR